MKEFVGSIPVSPGFARQSNLQQANYHKLYKQSVENPEVFWAEQAQRFVTWIAPWTDILTGEFRLGDTAWFVGGKLNVCYNCVDRHLATRAHETAIIWEGNNPSQSRRISYQALYDEICKFANVLKQQGVKKGDKIGIYMPMIPEALVAMLACARLGAVHSVVFAGFSPESLSSRMLDSACSFLITADEGARGDKTIPLKINCDKAVLDCPNIKRVIVVRHTGHDIPWNEARDRWYHEEMASASPDCPMEPMDASDPLFILYTSGSTGKPKGVVHATGGYLVYVAITYYYVFDHHPGHVYWCTADIGWITGHSYGVYGPLANGATVLMFEGVPNYPTHSRFWEVIDKHKVDVFYTAPTALRALRREGDSWVTQSDRKSLKLLGTVGEPINPDVWHWYHDVVGDNRCPIVDTWWQTETGGILISPLPGATPLVPGSAAWPFFGIVPEIIDEQGHPVAANQTGRLVIKQAWPGLMKTIYGDHQRFIDSYLKDIPGCYLTGDGAQRSEQGYITIAGRLDDVMKVSGHRIGTEEVESALLRHPSVSEAAVVGIPDDVTGERIVAFVITKTGVVSDDALKQALIQTVRNNIGSIAKPEIIHWVEGLPKTRSGKIMRRLLRKIACHELDDLGDLSTLADPGVIDRLRLL